MGTFRFSFVLALLGLSACGDGVVGQLGVSKTSARLCAADTYEDSPSLNGQAPEAPAVPDPTLLHWHCGQVLGPSHVTPIFWGGSWRSSRRPWVDGLVGFLGAFGSSRYANLVSEYRGVDESDNVIVASSAVTPNAPIFDDAPFPDPDASLTDEQTGREVCRLLNDAPDPSTLYVVYDERGPTGDACGQHHGSYFCRPDSTDSVLTVSIFDVGLADIFCPVPDDSVQEGGLGRLANVTAHEVMESITNPRLGGWYNDGGFSPGPPPTQVIDEAADKCQADFAHPVTLTDGSRWWLQAEWSNRAYREDAGIPGVPGCLQE